MVVQLEAIRTAEPWTMSSELAGIGLLILVGVGLYRVLRARSRR